MNDTDRSDATVITWKPAERAAHRMVFEPRSDGTFERIEEARIATDGGWHYIGSEIVESVEVEQP